MKRVLLTGAAGYLGTECVPLLKEAGFEVVATDIRIPARPIADVDFQRGDLTDSEAVSGLVERSRPDVVVHLAGLLSARESNDIPERYFRVNIIGSLNLIEAVLAGSCRRLIFASTNSTYGVPSRSPVFEDDPLLPHTPYGESKVAVERMLSWFNCLRGLSSVALRFFNLAGGDEFSRLHGTWSGALSTRLLAVALGEIPHLDVFGLDHPTPDGTCVRDYLHVRDAAAAVVAAVQGEARGAYNISGGSAVSVMDAVNAYRHASGREIKVIDRGRRAGDVSELIADIAKARRDLGWRPVRSSIAEIASSAWASVPQESRERLSAS